MQNNSMNSVCQRHLSLSLQGHGQDYLAKIAVGLHVRMRRRRVLQWDYLHGIHVLWHVLHATPSTFMHPSRLLTAN